MKAILCLDGPSLPSPRLKLSDFRYSPSPLSTFPPLSDMIAVDVFAMGFAVGHISHDSCGVSESPTEGPLLVNSVSSIGAYSAVVFGVKLLEAGSDIGLLLKRIPSIVIL